MLDHGKEFESQHVYLHIKRFSLLGKKSQWLAFCQIYSQLSLAK